MEYLVIGDIHGEADMLERLLQQAGFQRRGSGWRPPHGVQALFLGDLIDRGAQQLRVLRTVRSMVDDGHALCLLGNHELNAVGWVTPREGSPGEWLRPHTPNKHDQHRRFLEQVGEGSPSHHGWIDWFRGLPVALDLVGLRAVHAWWNPRHVECISAARPLEGDWLQQVFRKGSVPWRAYEELTKGCELALPEGATFLDKDLNERHEVRTQWWRDDARTYREIAVIEDEQRERIPDLPLPPDHAPTPVTGSPVFVGHYWLKGPVVRREPKLACLEFSAAGGGPLVGYHWRGEDEIDDGNFLGVR